MPKTPNYFGVAMGEAIAKGGSSISDALQRRYAIQRQDELLAKQNEEKMRVENRQDRKDAFGTNLQLGSMGVDVQAHPYDPNNPEASLQYMQPYFKQKQEAQGLANAKTQAEIDRLKRIGTDKPTIAQTAVDRAFGKEYSNYVAGGGYADVFGQIKSLREVQKKLAQGKDNLTGPIVGNIPFKSILRPKSLAAQQEVENTIQRTLRATLGAQFTEREGQLFMERGYDPRLPEKENSKKLERLATQLETMAKAKQDAIKYYEQHGTLSGFKGKLYTISNGNVIEGTPVADTTGNVDSFTPEEVDTFERMIAEGK